MKILKKKILIAMLFCFSSSGILIAQDKVFFSDTIFEFSGLKIRFEHGYGRGDVVKIKMVITNLTDRYAIINPNDIVVTLINGTEKRTWYEKQIVASPKDLVKVTLQFRDLIWIRKTPLNIRVKNIKFAETLLSTYSPLVLEASFGLRYESKALALEIIEVTPRSYDYAVKVKINYSGPNFLSINYNKALFVTAKGDFHNTRKSKNSYDNNLPAQNMLMIFPCSDGKGIKIPATINLNDVFKEYSLSTVAGFHLQLGFITEREFRNNKRFEEETIEEIE